MLSSIVARGLRSLQKPTNIVPCSPTVPNGVLRRKLFPTCPGRYLATCESAGLSSKLLAVELAAPDHKPLGS